MPEDSQPSAPVDMMPPMSPPDFKGELSEADMEKQCSLKQAAVEALEDGNADLALEKFNEAIALGTDSALLYSRRAQVLLQLNQNDAAINDCNEALKLNPDSAKAYKIRAKAYTKCEKWVEAHMDYSTGQKIDFDETLDEEVKEIAEKAKDGLVLLNKQRLEKDKEIAYQKMQEQKKAYEEAVREREPELREKRMEMEKEKERQKEDIRARNRARREEEEAKAKEEEDMEENEVHCDSEEEK